MARRPLLWQLYPVYVLITVFSVAAVCWFGWELFSAFHIETLTQTLGGQGQVIGAAVNEELEADDETLRGKLQKVVPKQSPYVAILDRSGTVRVSVGQYAPETGLKIVENDVIAAGSGNEVGRFLSEDMFYVSFPIDSAKGSRFLVRVGFPADSINETLKSFYARILVGGILVVFLAGLTLNVCSVQISRPLQRMRSSAQRFARGDFQQRLEIPETAEIAELAESMNAMAATLDERIKTILEQRNEQEAVLSSMVEGVLAVDANQHIININRTAAEVVGVDSEDAIGRSVVEVVRNMDLQRVIADTLVSQEPVEREIILYEGEGAFLQSHGTVLRDSEGQRIGAVVVLNDITKLRQLENIRKEFVANVSHELRTPITSIKGFVETLLDGAVADRENAEKFLTIIGRHADRLNAIIEDLLNLARIEQGVESKGIEFEQRNISEVISRSVELCGLSAQESGVSVTVDCDSSMKLLINPTLVEQALINLIDNAVKYSPTGSSVVVAARDLGKEIELSVEDNGPGIAAEHHPRIFERFYRIDKGRIRNPNQGGTGLGLAIVKHVALAHKGTVSLRSSLGAGCRFSLFFPKAV